MTSLGKIAVVDHLKAEHITSNHKILGGHTKDPHELRQHGSIFYIKFVYLTAVENINVEDAARNINLTCAADPKLEVGNIIHIEQITDSTGATDIEGIPYASLIGSHTVSNVDTVGGKKVITFALDASEPAAGADGDVTSTNLAFKVRSFKYIDLVGNGVTWGHVTKFSSMTPARLTV